MVREGEIEAIAAELCDGLDRPSQIEEIAVEVYKARQLVSKVFVIQMTILRGERADCPKVTADLITDKRRKYKKILDYATKMVRKSTITEKDIKRLKWFNAQQELLSDIAPAVLR